MTANTTRLHIRTERHVPKLGVMLVGWGGNNGTTVTAAILANQMGLSWPTRNGVQEANYFGSLFLSSTVSLGMGPDGKDVYVPLHDVLPMVHPNDIVLGGWDISSLDLASAMNRARVLEPSLQVKNIILFIIIFFLFRIDLKMMANGATVNFEIKFELVSNIHFESLI